LFLLPSVIPKHSTLQLLYLFRHPPLWYFLQFSLQVHDLHHDLVRGHVHDRAHDHDLDHARDHARDRARGLTHDHDHVFRPFVAFVAS